MTMIKALVQVVFPALKTPMKRCKEEETVYKISDLMSFFIEDHVLLNLLNKLRKRDKMRGLPSFLSLFRNEFNKFNNTGA